jgi:hypothetical protein
MKSFKDLGIKTNVNAFIGEKIKMERILNREIIVHDFEVKPSKFDGEVMTLQIQVGEEKRIVFTSSKVLIDVVQRVAKTDFPFTATIVKENEYFEFR